MRSIATLLALAAIAVSPSLALATPPAAVDTERQDLRASEGALGFSDMTGSPQWRQMLDEILASPEPIDANWSRSSRPAVGLSTLDVRNRIIVLEDDDGSIFERGFVGFDGNRSLNNVARQVYDALPNDFDFITIIIDWSVQGAFAFYMPLSNDTRGIGYGNLTDDDEVFDQTEGPLQGFIFMNNWRFYLRGQEGENLSRVVWLQEIGHRWGAFVRYDKGQGPKDDILGRDLAHWSYFMHSHNSALEGNDWNDNGDGSFSTFTNASRMTFSDLDLYLMGIAAPEEVPPFFVIRNPETGNLRDGRGGRIQRASPPETDGSIKTIRGERVDITLEDVINHEGTRIPDHRNSQKTFRMATVFITRSADNATESNLVQIEGIVEQWERFFEEATREEMNLITVLDGNEAPSDLPFGAECTDSEECDPSVATTCLTTEEGERICSRRCFANAECGEGFCCDDPSDTGALFCHPKRDTCPSEAIDPEPEPEPEPEGNNDPGDNNGPVEPPTVASANASDSGCATVPGRGGNTPLLLLLLPLIALRRP